MHDCHRTPFTYAPSPARSLVAALAFLIPTNLVAQTGAWATDTAAPGLGGRVFSFTTCRGEAYAGGYPFAAKDGEIASVARWDGTRWRAVGSGVDLIGGFGSFATPTVRSMCEFNGDLILAGTFDVAGGQPRNNIARFDGATFHAMGQGLVEVGWDADIRALAVFNNELYATGTFGLAGGLQANGIARWNGTSWSTCGSGLGGFGPGLVGHGESLLVVGNDLLVGGDFYYANGVPAQCIARWNGTTFLPMGAGFDGAVSALASYGGQVVAAGSFSFSGTTPTYGAAVWTGTSWRLLAPSGPASTIKALQTVGGFLYAGGSFTAPGPYVARFDGTTWSGIGGVRGVFSGTIPTAVLALGVHGTDLLVGGEFTRGGNPPEAGTAVVSTNVSVCRASTYPCSLARWCRRPMCCRCCSPAPAEHRPSPRPGRAACLPDSTSSPRPGCSTPLVPRVGPQRTRCRARRPNRASAQVHGSAAERATARTMRALNVKTLRGLAG